MLPWTVLSLACTTRKLSAIFRPGSRPMPTAWTIWNGCGGLPDSSVRPVASPGGGDLAMADTSARPAGNAHPCWREPSSTALALRLLSGSPRAGISLRARMAYQP